MEQTHINKVLLRNVGKLSRIDEREESMMPKGASPLPECLTLVYPNSLVPSSATVKMTQATFP